ncbi:MAG: hypothetical protein ACTIA5_17170 [Brachybacterium tyrofermentans]
MKKKVAPITANQVTLSETEVNALEQGARILEALAKRLEDRGIEPALREQARKSSGTIEAVASRHSSQLPRAQRADGTRLSPDPAKVAADRESQFNEGVVDWKMFVDKL